MQRKIIFLVEPSDRDCVAMKELLEGFGYEVIAQSDVLAALAVFPYTEASLVVTAFPLIVPELEADFTTLVKRQSPRTLVTGMVARSIDARHALISGCDAFLAKPLDPEVTRAHVRQMIGPARDLPTAEH